MSAIIYIKSGSDDDLTGDQLELLHRYSDQAYVWAHLLLKDADLLKTAGSREEIEEARIKTKEKTEKWRAQRDEWLALKEKLRALNEAYGTAVVKALQAQYQNKKEIESTTLPPAKDFLPPEQVAEATSLAEKLKKDFISLYPTRTEVGYAGPYLTDDEKRAIFSPPDIEGLTDEEAEAKMKEWREMAGGDLAKWTQTSDSPVMDMATGWATNQASQIVDPESGSRGYDASTNSYNEQLIKDFVQDVLARAIKSYNPFKAEDTGVGYEGRKATFGTYLMRTMINEIKSRKDAYARARGVKNVLPADVTIPEIVDHLINRLKVSPVELKEKVEEAGITEESLVEEWRKLYDKILAGRSTNKVNKVPISLDQPLAGEESLTVEETVAERAKKEDILNFQDYYEPFKQWLEDRVHKPGSRFPQSSADRMLDVFKKVFIDLERVSQVARDLNFITRSRPKEIAFLKKHGVDVSSLPATIPPGSSTFEDSKKRDKMIEDFFAKLKEASPEKYQEVRNEFDTKVSAPNVTYVSQNLIRGPFKGQTVGNVPYIMQFLKEQPEVAELIKEVEESKKKSALEEFLTRISTLRKEGGLNYNLLRNKIEQKLSEVNPQLFVVYTYLYEDTFSNPDTARLMRLSPPRITGLKKKIVSTLLDLPEIQNFFQEDETGSISPLRRFIYNEGDLVRVASINEIGVITSTLSDEWYNVHLNNGNDVLTVKEDIQKYCTLVDSANNVLSHYYSKEVTSPQCYLSLVGGIKPQLVILELRPVDAIKTTARLHINNSLVDITEITEKLPDNLLSILKGHIGASASLDTPFTSLFEEVG
jgi:hypothetical protein